LPFDHQFFPYGNLLFTTCFLENFPVPMRQVSAKAASTAAVATLKAAPALVFAPALVMHRATGGAKEVAAAHALCYKKCVTQEPSRWWAAFTINPMCP
jgi:hypothetical protein